MAPLPSLFSPQRKFGPVFVGVASQRCLKKKRSHRLKVSTACCTADALKLFFLFGSQLRLSVLFVENIPSCFFLSAFIPTTILAYYSTRAALSGLSCQGQRSPVGTPGPVSGPEPVLPPGSGPDGRFYWEWMWWSWFLHWWICSLSWRLNIQAHSKSLSLKFLPGSNWELCALRLYTLVFRAAVKVRNVCRATWARVIPQQSSWCTFWAASEVNTGSL